MKPVFDSYTVSPKITKRVAGKLEQFKYISICKKGNSGGVWYLSDFITYYVMREAVYWSNIEVLYINLPVPP